MNARNKVQLLRLKIANFRSFGKEQEISFSDDGDTTRKVTAIIGLNASGKSNLLRAMSVLQSMVKSSANADFKLPYDHFLFTEGYEDEPTRFELQFKCNQSLFIYSVAFNSEIIVSESLKEKALNTQRQKCIFERSRDIINPGAVNYGFNRALVARTRPNTLLITKAIENNNDYAIAVHSAINSFYILTCANGQLEGAAISLLRKHPELIQETLAALHKAEFSIQNIRLDDVMFPTELLDKMNIPEEAKTMMRSTPGIMMNSGHILKDDFHNPVLTNGSPTYVGLNIGEESIGTRAFLGVIVPIIDSIRKGKVLFVDEFGAYLHYNLVQRIITSYKKHDGVPGVIVCTHAGMMLNCIDRDSIFIMKKNPKTEESTIHKLSEERARLDENYSNGYYSNSRYELLRYKSDDLF